MTPTEPGLLMPIELPKRTSIDPASFLIWTVYAALLVALAAWLFARYAP